MTDAKAIRAALIGVGNSGRFYHMPQLLDKERFDLRVVVAEHGESASDAAASAGAQSSIQWRPAVERVDIELVVIALPHHLHHDVVLAALNSGKHVLVEKPLALSTREADELLEAAERSGVVLMVHHQRRWEADFVTIVEIVRSGELGELWRVCVNRSHQGLYRKASAQGPHNGAEFAHWPHDRSSGGGISQLVGPHPVDHMLTLANSAVVSVAGRVHFRAGEEVDDWIGIDAEFASGAMGHTEVFRWSGIAPPRFAVYGSEGMAISTTADQVDVRLMNGTGRSITGLKVPGVLGDEIYDDLYEAIRHGRTPRATAHQARSVVEVLELARRSANEGGRSIAAERAKDPVFRL